MKRSCEMLLWKVFNLKNILGDSGHRSRTDPSQTSVWSIVWTSYSMDEQVHSEKFTVRMFCNKTFGGDSSTSMMLYHSSSCLDGGLWVWKNEFQLSSRLEWIVRGMVLNSLEFLAFSDSWCSSYNVYVQLAKFSSHTFKKDSFNLMVQRQLL